MLDLICVQKRPDNKDAISLKDLGANKRYREMSAKNEEPGRIFTFLMLQEDQKHAKVKYSDNGEGETISLADRGVVPYDNGLWNKYNYVVPL